MFYLLVWLVVAALLALWSLAAWAVGAAAAWTVSNAGVLTGAAGTVALPGWLAPWVPAAAVQWVGQLMADVGPVLDRLLQSAPALAGGITAATWVVWGIGSVLLVLLGAGLHLLAARWRRRRGGGAAAGAGSPLATR